MFPLFGTNINHTVGNCRRCRWYRWQFTAGGIDTGSNFAAGIVDKFATSINNTSGTGGKIFRRNVVDTGSKFATGVVETIVDTGCKFATGVIDTGGASLLANISAIFEKNQNDPKDIFGGMGEHDTWKKPESKDLMTLSL